MNANGSVAGLVLFSGGLDSQLGTHLVRRQGVLVRGVHFVSVFWEGREEDVRASAAEIDLELVEAEISDEMIEVVRDPPHGYGKCMNPCLDCKILMLSRARRIMEEGGYRFLVTGEVVGQRPMSQRRDCFPLLEKAAEVCGLVVRPLSGKLLPATVAEERGWIDREELLAVSGRSRKAQLDIAGKLGLAHYSTPAGGCLLTDPNFSRRLRDLLASEQAWGGQDVRLLRMGRHFRLTPSLKLVVGRNEEENRRLETFLDSEDLRFDPEGVPGPLALLRGKVAPDDLRTALGIVARYSDHEGRPVVVVATSPDGREVVRKEVVAPPHREIEQLRV
jgi:tRNA-specific 2-thiouridylase